MLALRLAFSLSPVGQVDLIDAKRKRSGAVPAGQFARWLQDYAHAQTQSEPNADVPCGDCHACCEASYFIQISSAERETLALIPAARLTRSDKRGWVLDQSSSGRCPMLADGACSIYAARPRTCRRFDCRVFAAAGVGLGSGPRAQVNVRVWQWRFDYPSEHDAASQSAVLAAAAFLQRRADLIHPDFTLTDSGELARAAALVSALFLEPQATSDEPLAAAINQKLRELSEAHPAPSSNPC